MKSVKVVLMLTILLGGALLLHSCKKEKEYNVSSVSLDREQIEIGEGETAQLICTVKPKQATNKEVKWESSDPSIAHVNQKGVVTGLALGEASISVVSVDGNKKATCEVTVIRPVPVTHIGLTPVSLALEPGAVSILTAVISPDDATDKTITWTTSNSSVARVTPDGLTCKIEAIADGTAVITASTNNGKAATCNVTVSEGAIGQNVYISGERSSGAAIWKQQNVLHTFGEGEWINSIFVLGNDVYAVGGQSRDNKTIAQLWKNGMDIGLQNNVKHQGSSGYGPGALTIYVDEEDNTYVGGCNCIETPISGGISASNFPTIWKNGVELYRLHQYNGGWVNSIFVSGNDIYSAGDMYTSGYPGGGRVWKNETLLYDFNNTVDDATGIYVSEGDIYVAAITGTTGRVYKNGMVLYSLNAAPNSIFVSNGDVYVSGVGAIWKNGNVLYNLGTETAYSVVVKNNKVYYVAGNKVYKNDSPTTLPGCTEATAVFVK